MTGTVAQAQAVMQAVTVDIWNDTSEIERIKLLGQYCSPTIKAYAPNGSETTGIEDVRTVTSLTLDIRADMHNSAIATTTSSTPTVDETDCSKVLVIFG